MRDPLLQALDLPLHVTLHPLGFTLEVATNAPEILAAASQNWRGTPRAFDRPTLEFRILVTGDGPASATPVYRGQRHLMSVVADASNFAVADFERGLAYCFLTSGAARRSAWVRYFFLDGIVYSALSYAWLTPVHCAGVAFEGRGLLLCGPPGAGKSCLALACARAGATFLCDDVAFLVRGAAGRTVLGRPSQMRFRNSAKQIFPDLAGIRSEFHVSGKESIELAREDFGGIETASSVEAAHVVFLKRSASGEARLHPVERPEAWARLEAELALYGSHILEEQRASLHRLLEAGAWDLAYCDLAGAVSVLRQLAQAGAA